MLIKPVKRICGELEVPGDKSISHRAVMLGSIANGKTHITDFLTGEDCLSTIQCFRAMGVDIEVNGTDVTVLGRGRLQKPAGTLYAGNSGTTVRILTGLLSGLGFECEIDGDASIRKRPMTRVTRPLSLLGARLLTNEGRCPIKILPAELKGRHIDIDVASAQVKSAILMAGLYASGETSVTEPSPSRNHTELMLKAFGADIEQTGAAVRIRGGKELRAADIAVPGDISSAAFFIAAAAILPGSRVTVKNVGINPTRTGVLDALSAMGARISYSNIRQAEEPTADITAEYAPLTGAVIEGDLIPRLIDELPVLAVTALFAKGKTVIKDAAELRVKETDRIAVLAEELSKCGAKVIPTEDGMIIEGGAKPVSGAVFNSHGDHRIAMAMSVLALAAAKESSIEGAQAVAVSYPSFFSDLEKLSERCRA